MKTTFKLLTISLSLFLLGCPGEKPKPSASESSSPKPKTKKVSKATKKLARKAYNTFGPLPEEASALGLVEDMLAV